MQWIFTHLWPVPPGTWGVRRGCIRTRCLLYHPALLPSAAWYVHCPFGVTRTEFGGMACTAQPVLLANSHSTTWLCDSVRQAASQAQRHSQDYGGSLRSNCLVRGDCCPPGKGCNRASPSSWDEAGIYSPFFIVPKKSSGLWPILDLRISNLALLSSQLILQRLTWRTLAFVSWFFVGTACVRESGMAVQGPPLWALSVPSCLHVSQGGRPCPVTGSGHQDPQLSGAWKTLSLRPESSLWGELLPWGGVCSWLAVLLTRRPPKMHDWSSAYSGMEGWSVGCHPPPWECMWLLLQPILMQWTDGPRESTISSWGSCGVPGGTISSWGSCGVPPQSLLVPSWDLSIDLTGLQRGVPLSRWTQWSWSSCLQDSAPDRAHFFKRVRTFNHFRWAKSALWSGRPTLTLSWDPGLDTCLRFPPSFSEIRWWTCKYYPWRRQIQPWCCCVPS